MTDEIGWELYRSFLGVLTEGSLSGAARAMGVAQPTVGRHIASLEKSLKLVLFTRSRTGFAPTEAALALRPFAEDMLAAAEALERTAESQGEGVKGTVRLTASEVIGVEVLPPILARLQARYSELRVELVLTNRVQNLLRGEADIAVRMTKPDQGQLIARRIGDFEVGLFAHKSYLGTYGTPATLSDLASHRLIGFDQETPFLRSARKAFPGWQRESFALRCDSDIAQMAMIRAGGGIGACQVGVARRSRDLVRVLAREVSVLLNTWLAMHEDLRTSPRCRVTFDALLQGLREHLGRHRGGRITD